MVARAEENNPTERPITSLSPAPDASTTIDPTINLEIGNLHTFRDLIYLSKDIAKLAALPHIRKFLTDGFTPVDSAKWVKWLAHQMKIDSGYLRKVDKSGTLKLETWNLPRLSSPL